MKVEIESKELLELINDSNKLNYLERGGVDNWEWYAESLDKYKPTTDLSSYGVSRELKYYKGDNLYYNNNSCYFVSYLNEDFAVIIVQAYPDFDNISGDQWCHPCNIGGTSTHTCDMAQEIIDILEENTSATNIPLIVSVKMLYDKPLVVSKHEEQVERLETTKQEILEKTKTLSLRNIELAKENEMLEEKINKLKELEENYK